MKNLFIYILAFAAFCTGCKKETKELFDKPVDQFRESKGKDWRMYKN